MSGCCSANPEARAERESSMCPACGAKAKPVATLTVKNLLRDHAQASADQSYWFCRQPYCDVVYFSEQCVFQKPDLKVRVGLKEREDPIPLCYCFGYDRSDLKRDIDARGDSAIPNRIKAEVQAGFCACEVKNPSGNCCLGDINRAIKEAEGQREAAR